MTVRDKARKHLSDGDLTKALRIAKELDITYSKEELRVLGIAYETMSGKHKFYEQIGLNVKDIEKEALSLLNRLNH